EARASPLDILRRNFSTMRLNYRAHDCQTHAQAFWLGCEKLFENKVACLNGNARALVLHGNLHGAVVVLFGSNFDFSALNGCLVHRVESVGHEVDQDLLKLKRITFCPWESIGQRKCDSAGTQSRIGLEHMANLFYKLVQVYPLPNSCALF